MAARVLTAGTTLLVGTRAWVLQPSTELDTRSDAEVCACLNWKQAYASKTAICGSTNEFFLIDGQHYRGSQATSELAVHFGPEFCTRFFETIDDNYCINVNMGRDAGQWCYVDSACIDLNGGERQDDGSQASWKICDASEGDKVSRNYTPQQLAGIAEKSGLDLGLLHKMAYPMPGIRYNEIAGYFGIGPTTIQTMPLELGYHFQNNITAFHQHLESRFRGWDDRHSIGPGLSDVMDKIVASNLPTSFDMDKDQHPPHIIVHGERVYMVFGGLICLKGC